jgi:hypothetical protein
LFELARPKFKSGLGVETPMGRGQEGRELEECRVSVTPGSREGRYAKKALSNAFSKLANEWPRDGRGRPKRGGRNDLLNKLAFKMGGLVANGWIDGPIVIKVLMGAALDCKLIADYSAEQCRATILSGLSAGVQWPYPPLGPYDPGARSHSPGSHGSRMGVSSPRAGAEDKALRGSR